MRRAELAAAIAAAAPNHVIITSLGSAGRAWRDHGGPNPTFFGSDPMGAAPGLALGAALARPDLQFLLLEGDGDLVMNLGALLAIADAGPGNLRVVVFHNGRYETGGGQPLAAAGRADLGAVALAAGWPWVRTLERAASGDTLRAGVEALLAAGVAPALLVAEVDAEESPYGGPGELSGVEARVRFQEQLRNWESRREHAG
ncbi:thiamine pyrophosphate-dependent enzyme [Dactylosporangium salmoneum]|uniref:Thiamine pyrophosphate enzyme TPP-binding domain-containing protein n=1 Tax=Dactylosporangium salmoneum TaxID=53361 RepID=A0ABP5VBH2_9ACTN